MGSPEFLPQFGQDVRTPHKLFHDLAVFLVDLITLDLRVGLLLPYEILGLLGCLPRTVDRVGFDQVVLKMDPDAVGRFWIDRKIRGGSGPPRTVFPGAPARLARAPQRSSRVWSPRRPP